MHRASRRMMRRLLQKNLDRNTVLEIVDVGSYDVNGNYRILMEDSWKYTGVDIEEGPNVDVVMPEAYRIPLEDEVFDVAISGNCFEHAANPFKLMKEVSRIVKPNGLFFMTVPWIMPEHRFPIDCWRILRDGWESLFSESGIETIETFYHEQRHPFLHDSWAIGRKS